MKAVWSWRCGNKML